MNYKKNQIKDVIDTIEIPLDSAKDQFLGTDNRTSVGGKNAFTPCYIDLKFCFKFYLTMLENSNSSQKTFVFPQCVAVSLTRYRK